jgi:hypothetical protein
MNRLKLVVLALTVALLPASAHAQEFYKFTWDVYAQGHSAPNSDPQGSGYRDGSGLASVRPRGDGGLIVKFEGAGGAGIASVEAETAQVNARCVAAMVTVPIRLGTEDSNIDSVPGCYSWIGEFGAPESFVLAAFNASQGGVFDFAGGGARLLARPTFASPADGSIVSGDVPVTVEWQGPLLGTPVGVQLLVDGVLEFGQTTTAGSVTHAWDTRTAADGSRRLEVWLTDSEGTRIVRGATITVTIANATGGPPVVIVQN